jgi:hypothetical protein
MIFTCWPLASTAVLPLRAGMVIKEEAVINGTPLSEREDEHHRRQVVQVPAHRDLDQIRLLPAYQRFHPLARLLRIIDGRPAVANADVIRLQVVVHQAMIAGRGLG